MDRLVGNLAAQGIEPVPFIFGSPSWVAKRPWRPPLGSARKVQAWRGFLTDLVDRYGRGGAYWSGAYRHQHPGATAEPITAWQIWNEPNLSKFFPRKGRVRKYARLVRIAHDAITAADPGARILLAGMPGYASPTAWGFLNRLYRVSGIENDFDAVAVHPYSATIGQFRAIIANMRGVMRRHGDGGTALWLTEVGWGSADPAPRWPINKGTSGQDRMLRRSFKLVLRKRASWNVERLLWFDWRDPAKGTRGYCSFCDSSGLVRHNHKPKPAYRSFKHFALSP